MIEFTIITTATEIYVTAGCYRRDDDGDLYCYEDENAGDPVAHVDNDEFVAIFESEHGTTLTA